MGAFGILIRNAAKPAYQKAAQNIGKKSFSGMSEEIGV